MLRLVIALILLAGPAAAFAQDVFDPGQADLKVGQNVRVLVDGTCETTPCQGELVKGKVVQLTETSLIIDEERGRRELAATKIAFVERPRDRIWDGALVGFAVGFTVGFVSVMVDDCSSGWFCGPGFASALGLFAGGIGAGVGFATDVAISHRRVIYTRAVPNANRSLAPTTRGISFSVRF